jgi:hypothetical protein
VAVQAGGSQAPLAWVQVPRIFAEVTRAEEAASDHAALWVEAAHVMRKNQFSDGFFTPGTVASLIVCSPGVTCSPEHYSSG